MDYLLTQMFIHHFNLLFKLHKITKKEPNTSVLEASLRKVIMNSTSLILGSIISKEHPDSIGGIVLLISTARGKDVDPTLL